jgi:hypothetical protein
VKAIKLTFILFSLVTLPAAALVSCGSGTGACVGSGGLLASPECKEDWDEAECEDWDAQEVNGASWTFHGGDTCDDLGYTEMCSDGSYRRPGAC